MWWHPDSLATLFVVLTLFALARDNLRFGRWFFLAGAFCGLATGTKVLGFYFFLTVGIYLVLGRVSAKLPYPRLLRHAAVFCGCMVLAIVLSNPLLLHPKSARTIINTLRYQAQANEVGWNEPLPKGPAVWYRDCLRPHFGFWWMFLTALVCCVWGIARERGKRLLNVLILTWVLPLSLYMLFRLGNKPMHYPIPLVLPLLSCVGNLGVWFAEARKDWRRNCWRTGCLTASAGVCLAQWGYYVGSDIRRYRDTLYREERSGIVALYRALEREYLPSFPRDRKLVIFRDPAIYVPPAKRAMDVRMDWQGPSYEMTATLKPDLVLLQKDYVVRFSHLDFIARSHDPEMARKKVAFYRDARSNRLKGYRKLLETDAAVAFVRE